MLLALCISGAMAQNPTLSRVTAAPETDETQLFIQQFHRILNQVINDYPNRFKNIITGPVSEEESDVFLVSAALPVALPATHGEGCHHQRHQRHHRPKNFSNSNCAANSSRGRPCYNMRTPGANIST